MQNFYKILGIGKDADDAAIAKAYKALAKRFHPDVNAAAGGTAGESSAAGDEKLREVIEAYKALSRPADRAAYDDAWNRRRAEQRRRIAVIVVLAMAGSLTLASLSAAYLWRAQLLAARDMVARHTSDEGQSAGKQPPEVQTQAETQAEVAPPPPRLAARPPTDAPIPEAATPEAPRFPAPAVATSPAAGEVVAITGPARVARSVHALSAAKASEVRKFAEVAVIEVVELAEARREGEPQPEPSVAGVRDWSKAPPAAPPEAVPAPWPRPRAPTTAPIAANDSLQLTLPLPDRPPSQVEIDLYPALTRQQALALVSEQYLSGERRQRRMLLGLYCSRVDYWGETATSRTSVVNQIADFVSRWPHRAYKLRPGSFVIASAGHPSKYKVEFTYDFTVASGHGYGGAAGVARGRLTIERQNGRWRICSEEGRVLQRTSPYAGHSVGNSSKHAGGTRMDTHRILFGD